MSKGMACVGFVSSPPIRRSKQFSTGRASPIVWTCVAESPCMRSGNPALGSRRRSARRGAVLAEAAIVIFVFLILVFGMMDLGIGVARNNALSQAARQGVRQAIVHGRLAPSGWNGG